MLFIVTGTINPNPNILQLVLKNGDERLQQYINSIKRLLCCNNIYKLIFAENSDAKVDLSELHKITEQKNTEFEFLQFQRDVSKVVSQGKGFGGGEIINYCQPFLKMSQNK